MKNTSLLTLVFTLFLLPASGQEKASLTLARTVPLPDVQGGFNHMSTDAEHQRLFAPATTAKTLEIIDLKAGRLLRSLPGDRPAAALFAWEFNQLYVTRGHNICIYDGSTFNLVTSVALSCSLDEMGCDSVAKVLYVGCMDPDKYAIAVISIPDGKSIGEIKLPGKPQGFAVEQNGSRIFACVPALNAIAVLDREKKTPLDTWVLKDVSGNYPVALDETNHRLFVGCRHPAQLLVLDTTTGKPVASVPIGSDTDDLSYDPNLKRIYIACGEGIIDVVEQRDADHYQLRDRISVPSGSRNSCFSPIASEFYLAVPESGSQAAEVRVFKPQK